MARITKHRKTWSWNSVRNGKVVVNKGKTPKWESKKPAVYLVSGNRQKYRDGRYFDNYNEALRYMQQIMKHNDEAGVSELIPTKNGFKARIPSEEATLRGHIPIVEWTHDYSKENFDVITIYKRTSGKGKGKYFVEVWKNGKYVTESKPMKSFDEAMNTALSYLN